MNARLSTQPSGQLGILGKIKVGERTERGAPSSLDYFRFYAPARPDRAQMMHFILGDNPRELTVTFMSNDPAECCLQRLEIRDYSGKVFAYGDGQVFNVASNGEWRQAGIGDGMPYADAADFQVRCAAYLDNQAQGAGKSKYKAVWEQRLIMRLYIPQSPEFGLWEFSTKADASSIPQIIGQFDAVLEHAGRVKGLPFRLTVEKVQSNMAGTARRFPVVNLFCDMSAGMLEQVEQARALPHGMLTPEKISELAAVSEQ